VGCSFGTVEGNFLLVRGAVLQSAVAVVLMEDLSREIGTGRGCRWEKKKISRVENRGEIQELVVSLQDPKRCRSMVLGYEGILRAECLFKWSSSLELDGSSAEVLEYCMY